LRWLIPPPDGGSFLERFDDEVAGRSAADMPKDVRTRIQVFARGGLAKTDQSELMILLSQNPAWIAHLATEVKALRPAQNP